MSSKNSIPNTTDFLSQLISNCEKEYLNYKVISESMTEFKELVKYINIEVKKSFPDMSKCIFVKDDFKDDDLWFEIHLNSEFCELFRNQLLDIFDKHTYSDRRFYIDSNYPDYSNYFQIHIHHIPYNRSESVETYNIFHLNLCFKDLLELLRGNQNGIQKT